MDDPQAPLDLGLGRESPPPLAHRLEKNAWSWKLLVGMGHLRLRKWASWKDTLMGREVRGDGSGPGFSAQRRRVTKTLPKQTAYRKPSHSGADTAFALVAPGDPTYA